MHTGKKSILSVSLAVFFLVFMGCPTSCLSQGKIDSLLFRLAAHPQPDTVRVRILSQLGNSYIHGSVDSLRMIGLELVRTAGIAKSDEGLFNGKMHIGISYLRQQADVAKGLIAFSEGYEIARRHPEPSWRKYESMALMNIAGYYYTENNQVMARLYQNKAKQTFEILKDTGRIIDSYRSIGMSFHDQGVLDSAIQSYQAGLKLAIRVPDKNRIGLLYGDLGGIYYDKKEFNQALNCFKYCQDDANLSDNPGYHIGILKGLGNVYTALGSWDKARRCLFQALQMSEKINESESIDILESLSRFYEHSGKPDSALYFYKKYMNSREEQLNGEKRSELSKLETQFRVKENEQENLTLRKEAQLTAWREKVYLWGLILACLVAVVIGWLLWELRKTVKVIDGQKKQLNHNNAILQETIRDKRFFVSLLAHDLRSPFAVIRMGIGELRERLAQTAATEQALFESLEQSSDKVNDMIRKIIEVENVDETILEANSEILDARPLIAQAIQDYKEEAGAKEIRVESKLSGELLSVKANAELLKRVLGNLILNSIKYSPKGTQILIIAGKTGPWVDLTVLDEGPGFSPGQESMIFQKYYRTGGTKTTSLGLGLYLVKQYIQFLGGEITARNRARNGAEVAIKIPYIIHQTF
jgi:signal transduction histidine kinase